MTAETTTTPWRGRFTVNLMPEDGYQVCDWHTDTTISGFDNKTAALTYAKRLRRLARAGRVFDLSAAP